MKKVYYNANVITMEKDAMHAQAFVVEDGHFTTKRSLDPSALSKPKI